MEIQHISAKKQAAANRNIKERDFWLNKLSGELVKVSFPYDYSKNSPGIESTGAVNNTRTFQFPPGVFHPLMRLSGSSDYTLHMILAASLVLLLARYSFENHGDIIVGTPVYKQDVEAGVQLINTILPLRTQLKNHMTFKQLLLKARETIIQATENYRFPIEILEEHLNIPGDTGNFPLFDVALLLENIHDRSYIDYIPLDMLFSFSRKDNGIEGVVDYNSLVYRKSTIERIITHFIEMMENALANPELKLNEIDILTEEEKKQILIVFNDSAAEYPVEKTIHGLFREQVHRTPDNIAVIKDHVFLTYGQLNRRSHQLARWLQKKGVTAESVVGVMLERSIETIVTLMGILAAGGAYLPIDTGLPKDRVLYMLENSKAEMLISTGMGIKGIPFTALRGFEKEQGIKIKRTPMRKHIEEFDRLPIPDRSWIDFRKYKNKIGMASVTNCISLQTTRGCPYECLYCHKIWAKSHVRRSGENIFSEIEYYYKKGVSNFAIIDDSFNLDMTKSSEVFQKIIQNRLKLQVFFPNGVRGDILTPEYIDLMVEAGTRGINLSLETASPRLQKLLKKNLDLDKFKKVMDYIAGKHPGVILELAVMHGFPTETEEEALKTLDFIKSIRWLHFPYIHILKIYPNTEMEDFALEHGVSMEDILASRDRAFHELPETLPFPKAFTRKYQANFLNEYFLDKERLQHVLPYQMKVVTEAALAQKYNAYLPVEIKSIRDIIRFTQLEGVEIPEGKREKKDSGESIFDQAPRIKAAEPGAKKILFLDLSQHFSTHSMLYNVVEQPLGLIYLATYLKQRFNDRIDARVYKSGNDFNSFKELNTLVKAYNPDLVAMRSLTFFKEFFHETASILRKGGLDVPIISGGPYASSDYHTILKDKNIHLVVFGEGEYTLGELIEEMLKRDFKLPGPEVLDRIPGIVYAQRDGAPEESREIVLLDRLTEEVFEEEITNPVPAAQSSSLAYVMYTSGSTGRPKGVMVEHRQVNNCINWMQDRFKLSGADVVAQRTNLTFDPSVWEIFWPLAVGGGTRIIPDPQSRDAEFLIGLMREDPGVTLMYCPATLVNIMAYLLESSPEEKMLILPLLIIGAEPISVETVKQFHRHFAGRIVNTYGPTEGTINNTYYELSREDSREVVPIGKPIANNKIYILSRGLSPMPVNILGEICIAGDSVARGYINNREKTEQVFIPNPFANSEERLYKTGDIGRWLEDGNIEIMGRLDEQVKIRGHRIELAEIENAMLQHDHIHDCIVAAKDSNELQEKTRECKKCGIWSNYPGTIINSDGICNICENMETYKKLIHQYFLTMDHLEKKLKPGNIDKKSKYDCLLVYACERVATYALYKLTDMGFNVLTATYDSGHYERDSLDRIKAITSKIGVDHIFLSHERSDDIMRESLRTAKTMCKGCIHTSTSLAGEYAYKHGIKFVIGETLSRGQIVENKLYKFIEMGVNDINELEREIDKLQRNTALIDKKIFDIINIDIMNDGSVYDQVEFIDFYRYCDVTNEEMIRFLNTKDPYWQELETTAIYSTDCKICQVGNFNHLKEKGYHYTGSAKSWDKRLGLTSLESLKKDLEIDLTPEAHGEFLKNLGYREANPVRTDGKYLCAYFVSDKELTVSHLREYLSNDLPDYMIPTYFTPLDRMPLTRSGKVDRKALPIPEGFRPQLKESYVAPGTGLEKTIAAIWAEVLKVDMAGIHDNFFDLGGSSLDIIMVGNKLAEVLEKEIPAVTLFTYPTIGSLSKYLSEGEVEETVSDEEIDESFDQMEEAVQTLIDNED